MPDLFVIAAIGAGVWLLSILIATGGYLIGKRSLSRSRAIRRVILLSAVPALLVISSIVFIALSQRPMQTNDSIELHSSKSASLPDKKQAMDTLDDRLQQAVNNLPLGDVLFHHPDEMQLRKQEMIQVRISQDQEADLARGLSAQGVSKRDQVKISSSMKVSVFGDPNFDVKRLTDEEQLVTEKGYAEWSFTVVPLKKGNWPLHLVVSAVIRTPWGTEKFRDYPVKDEFVQVKVTSFRATEYFVEDNWQWTITAILIPLIAWLWKSRDGAKTRKSATKSLGVMRSVSTTKDAPSTAAKTTPLAEDKKDQPPQTKSA